MILLNINDRKWYYYEKGFAEDVIDMMFEEYFGELYQKDAVKWRLDEIWEKISMKIPKRAVFVEKDSVLYSVSSNLKFEAVPEEFFEIDEISHPVLIECFKKCYSEFKNIMKSYKEWDKEVIRNVPENNFIANVYLGTSRYYVPKIEYLSKTLDSAKYKFKEILQISLKPKMCNEVIDKIIELYNNTLLQNNPIMLITKEYDWGIKIYAVTDSLEIKEVTYSLIERELEEIIHEIVPEDTDFLVNRIYNHMIFPSKFVKPYIRIKKVQNKGLINAILYLKENDIPVVSDYKLKEFYTFLKITHNGKLPFNRWIRYKNYQICIDAMEPCDGMEKISKVNQKMFNEMSCYVENPGKQYERYDYDRDYGSCHLTTSCNLLYKLKDGKIEKVYRSSTVNSSGYEKFKKIMEEEGAKADKEGVYAFWKITLGEYEE